MQRLEPSLESEQRTTSTGTNLLESEDINPRQLKLPQRDRSPHPYLYHTEELRALRHASTSSNFEEIHAGEDIPAANEFLPPPTNSASPSSPPTTTTTTPPTAPSEANLNGSLHQKTPYVDHDGRTRRRTAYRSTTTTTTITGGSESGTEADDEGTSSFVKALPAPAHRPHKGLRGATGDDVDAGLEELDALLTPSFLLEQKKGGEKGGGYFDETQGKRRGQGGWGGARADKQEVERKWEEFR